MRRPIPRRSIRLKEWLPNIDIIKRPAKEYLSAVGNSLIDKDYRLRTDSNGFIISGFNDFITPCDKEIYFFGDSFIESVFVDEKIRFPAIVENMYQSNGVNIKSLNGGYSGATTLHLINSLINKIGYRDKKCKVIFMAPSNDAICLNRNGGYWGYHDKRYSPLIPVPEDTNEHNSIKSHSASVMLPILKSACVNLKIELILATFPHRDVEHSGDTWLQKRYARSTYYNKVRNTRRAVNSDFREFAIENNIPVLDFEREYSGMTDFFYDDLHLNETGSKAVGKWVFDSLCTL